MKLYGLFLNSSSDLLLAAESALTSLSLLEKKIPAMQNESVTWNIGHHVRLSNESYRLRNSVKRTICAWLISVNLIRNIWRTLALSPHTFAYPTGGGNEHNFPCSALTPPPPHTPTFDWDSPQLYCILWEWNPLHRRGILLVFII